MAEKKKDPPQKKSASGVAIPSKEELQKLQAARLQARSAEASKQHDVEAERKKELIAELSKRRVTDQNVKNAVARIRELAAAGETEVLVLRFPNELCTDGGRAINNNEPGWPKTLTGFPQSIHQAWESALRDHGYRLTAKILEFPGGMPGDVGLFLSWG